MLSVKLGRKSIAHTLTAGIAVFAIFAALSSIGSASASAEPIADFVKDMPKDATLNQRALLNTLSKSHADIDVLPIDEKADRTAKNAALNFNGQVTISLNQAVSLNPKQVFNLVKVTHALRNNNEEPDHLTRKHIWYRELSKAGINPDCFDDVITLFEKAGASRNPQVRVALLSKAIREPKELAKFGTTIERLSTNEALAQLDNTQLLQLVRVARSLAKQKQGQRNPELLSDKVAMYRDLKQQTRLMFKSDYARGEKFLEELGVRNRFPKVLTDLDKKRMYELWRQPVKNLDNWAAGADADADAALEVKRRVAAVALSQMGGPSNVRPTNFATEYELVMALLNNSEKAELSEKELTSLTQKALVAACDVGVWEKSCQGSKDLQTGEVVSSLKKNVEKLSFRDAGKLAYHTAKHHDELPLASRAKSNDARARTQAYLAAARKVISNAKPTRQEEQTSGTKGNTGNYTLTFEREYQSDNCIFVERVVVGISETQKGFKATIKTFIPRKFKSKMDNNK